MEMLDTCRLYYCCTCFFCIVCVYVWIVYDVYFKVLKEEEGIIFNGYGDCGDFIMTK